MTPEPILHAKTAEALQVYIENPAHAVVFTAPAGMGKKTVARYAAERLIGGPLENYPYTHTVAGMDGKAISIDQVRALEHLMALRIPAGSQRVVLIFDAHTMTAEAANALLKTLEEPPVGTLLLLTATSEAALLPTIRSRLQVTTLTAPTIDQLQTVLPAQTAAQILAMSGGLPGLAFALAADDQSHPLVRAAETARELLRGTTFTRLTQIDALAKNKEQVKAVLYILMQMSHAALVRGGQGADRWRKVLQAALDAEKSLLAGGQTKLVLIRLMLSL